MRQKTVSIEREWPPNDREQIMKHG